jgi:hypothetical protein
MGTKGLDKEGGTSIFGKGTKEDGGHGRSECLNNHKVCYYKPFAHSNKQ